ncbi:type II secretion system protein [Eubacterium barkeri]|uniref:Prepilin-type N-terminal cleavage/methylation domain-containing protein n=1 Tax=Eubacterium barkeri TaxID=1528 RepID=A0A1H3AWP1_EUBBA|nr:prepilin-type N-terminal cleavage/methylation domain-containing protein [Eubacterium barkeri]SDX34025.1 prepilin-type N-terminal cleavage/methylation domain-containing protein [Eubacterium barkeri]
MGTHLRKLMARNNGMTLVEVIVALLLFSMVFLILLYGINSALKVMGNAQAINNATQSNVSKLESLGSSLEAEGATLTNLGDKLTIDGKAIAGTFKVATTKKSNDQTDLSLTLFQPGTPRSTPPLPSVMPNPAAPGNGWPPYVPKPENAESLKSNTDTYNHLGDKLTSTAYDRIVITDSVTGNINGSVPQLFLTGSPAINLAQNKKVDISANFLYISGDLYGTNAGNSDNSTTFIISSKGTNNQEKALVYFSKDITIKLTSTNNKGELSGSIKQGYYLLPAPEKDGFNLFSILSDETVKPNFSKKVTEGGYYYDLQDSECLAQLKTELINRDIKLENANDSNAWINPSDLQ